MPVIHVSPHPTVSRSPVSKAWVMWAGGVVIVAQLMAVGVVVSRQVDQAAARQVSTQQAPAAPVVAQH